MKALALCCLLFFTPFANAAISDFTVKDLYTPGDGLITATSTLEWLDLTVTSGRSYNDVIATLEPGGDLFGWRYATLEEAGELVIMAGLPTFTAYIGLRGGSLGLRGVTYTYDSMSHAIVPFVDLIGGRVDHGIYGFTGITGTTSSIDPEKQIYIGATWLENLGLVLRLAGIDSQGVDRDYISSSFLVRPSAVPIPAAIWFMGSSLLGLFVFGYRSRK